MLKLHFLAHFIGLLIFASIQPGWTAEIIADIENDRSAADLEYCFVNDSLIRRKVDGALLNITQEIGQWLLMAYLC